MIFLYLFIISFLIFITIVFEYKISYLDLITGKRIKIQKGLFGLIASSFDLDINIYSIDIKIKEIHHVSECYLKDLFKKKNLSILIENIISLTIVYIIVIVLWFCYYNYVSKQWLN
jgi:hypothetical protein